MTIEETQKIDGNRHFVSSLDLTRHPMRSSKQRQKADYFVALEYIVKQCSGASDYIDAPLDQYRKLLVNASCPIKSPEHALRSLTNRIMPWRRKYRYWLLCDLALILLDEAEIRIAYAQLCNFLSHRQAISLDELYAVLWNDEIIPDKISFAAELINQFRANRRFFNKPLTRILVTATMSAGKSTLINAFAGEDVLETGNTACTSRVQRVFNKPFDDGIAKRDGDDTAIYMGVFADKRFCFVDTPGVNSARHPPHREITLTAITAGQYDAIVYIFNAQYLGTIDDDSHLRYVLKNKPQNLTIIFVLNQLDAFDEDDSINESLNKLREFLERCGIQEPIICPVSAKAGRLARRVCKEINLNKREKKLYDIFSEDFASQTHDLSIYYDASNGIDEIQLLKQCGLRGLEQILLMV